MIDLAVKTGRFRLWVRGHAEHGYLVTPTECAAWIYGTASLTGITSKINGRYSRIRIEEFERAGFVKVNGRWRKGA